MTTVDKLVTDVQLVGVYRFISHFMSMTNATDRLFHEQEKLRILEDRLATRNYTARQRQAMLDRIEQQGRNVKFATEILEREGKLMMAMKGILVVSAIFDLAKAAVQATLKVESLRTRLTTLYRDASKGDIAFRWAENFGKTFGVKADDVTDALVKLGKYGIQPTEARLRTLFSTQIQTEKSLETIITAIGKAGMGKFDALHELGISKEDVMGVSKAIFDAHGNLKNFQKALEIVFDLLNQKNAGAIERQSQELSSAIERMSSSYEQLKRATLDASSLTGMYNAAANYMDKMIYGVYMMRMMLVEFQLWIAGFGWLLGVIQNWFPSLNKPELEKKSEKLQEEFQQFLAGQTSMEPPGIPKDQLRKQKEAESGMDRLVQQILGGGEIGRLGIKATEIPGLQPKKESPVRVHIDADRKLEDIVNEILDKMHRQGAFDPQPA